MYASVDSFCNRCGREPGKHNLTLLRCRECLQMICEDCDVPKERSVKYECTLCPLCLAERKK